LVLQVLALIVISAASGAAMRFAQAPARRARPVLARVVKGPGSPTGEAISPAPTSTASPPSAPHEILTSPFDAPFRAYVDSRPGRLSAAVYDAVRDRVFVFRGGMRFNCASIVKVQIMATLLYQAQRTGRPLSEDVIASMRAMIEISDNDSASHLWVLAGGSSGIAAFDRTAGMTATTPDPYARWGNTLTTALDQVRLLRTLALPGHLLGAAQRRMGLGLMEQVDPDQAWGVSAGVPDGSIVALKNGWLPVSDVGSIVNSVGWVSGFGRDYVVALLSDQNPTIGEGIETLDEASTLIWKALPRR
jgi:hypothetical protein